MTCRKIFGTFVGKMFLLDSSKFSQIIRRENSVSVVSAKSSFGGFVMIIVGGDGIVKFV